MKKLIALVLWAVLLPTICFAQGPQKLCYTTNGQNCVPAVQASNSVAINISSSTTTELVAASTGKKIYATHFNVVAGGTGTFQLVYGTGTNCGTNQQILTGAYSLTAQNGLAPGDGLAPILFVPLSNALCAITVGAVQYSGFVSYAQF